jgi:DNA-binding CsgD family transcriptional regulator
MIEAIVADQRDQDDTFQESVHFHRAEALLWDGKPARALAEWPEHRRHTADSSDLIAYSSATFAWAALWCGEPVPDFGDQAPTTVMCQAAPFEVAGIRAMSAERWDDAVDQFDRAAERWQRYSARGWVRSRWGAAEATRRAGNADQAVTRLLAVEQDAAGHDMAPLLGQIRSSLRSAGVIRSAPRLAGRRSSAGSGASSGPDSLSGRERQVLTLVGQGLSDAAIGARLGVSPRTVESQLASARRKLGARTRHQAAAMLAGG